MQTLADIIEPQSNNFTLIRILAAWSVMWSHAMELQSGSPSGAILAGIMYYNLGDQAVNVFFVLSGIMVSASLERSPSYGRFIIARLIRIFPGLVVCTALLAFVVGPLFSQLPLREYFENQGVMAFVGSSLFTLSGASTLPGVFVDKHTTAANAPIWTLKYEIACYFVLVGLAAFGIYRRKTALLIVVAVTWFVSAGYLVQLPEGRLPTLGQAARFWICFSTGILAFRFKEWLPISGAVVAVLCVGWWIFWHDPEERIIAPVASGYLALWASRIPIGRLRELSNDYDISYGTYIFGWPITQALLVSCPRMHTAALVVVSFGLTAIVALASWILIERPAVRFGRDAYHGSVASRA